jgi:hypothetical protein
MIEGTVTFTFRRNEGESTKDFRARVLDELAESEVLMPPQFKDAIDFAVDDACPGIEVTREPPAQDEPWELEVIKRAAVH